MHNTLHKNPTEPSPQTKQSIWEIIKFIILALLIVIPLRFFIAQPFVVNGESMFPTFESGDYLIIDELSYRFESPERGDVIVFRFPLDPKRFFIKRIIGLPGETVMVRNNTISIESTEDGEIVTLDEPYLMNVTTDGSSVTKLDADQYFVLGDNRNESSDSRTWGILEKKYIIGRAWARLLPVSQIQLKPGDFSFSEK